MTIPAAPLRDVRRRTIEARTVVPKPGLDRSVLSKALPAGEWGWDWSVPGARYAIRLSMQACWSEAAGGRSEGPQTAAHSFSRRPVDGPRASCTGCVRPKGGERPRRIDSLIATRAHESIPAFLVRLQSNKFLSPVNDFGQFVKQPSACSATSGLSFPPPP